MSLYLNSSLYFSIGFVDGNNVVLGLELLCNYDFTVFDKYDFTVVESVSAEKNYGFCVWMAVDSLSCLFVDTIGILALLDWVHDWELESCCLLYGFALFGANKARWGGYSFEFKSHYKCYTPHPIRLFFGGVSGSLKFLPRSVFSRG